MATIEYNKIVRDKIPEHIRSCGKCAVCDVLPSEEALSYLEKKLFEEATEYTQSKEPEELADLVEVIQGILYHRGISWEALEAIRKKKYDERGGFEKGIRLNKVVE